MAISCAACGTTMPDISVFCPRCGRPVVNAQEPALADVAPLDFKTRLAGAAAYLAVIPAAVLLLIDPYKRTPFVRFHAFQSIVFAVTGLLIAGVLRLMWIPLFMLPMGLLLALLTTMLVAIGWFILWMVITVKAFQGESFRIPVLAGLADALALRVPGSK